jgi:hypothetical protein
MICKNCGSITTRIKSYANGSERCHKCGGFSPAGGPKVDGSLTRASFRVRTDAVKFQGDTLPAHQFNKMTKRWEVNPEFVKLNPDKAPDYYTAQEMKEANVPKLKEHKEKLNAKAEQEKVEFVGDTQSGIEKVIKEL